MRQEPGDPHTAPAAGPGRAGRVQASSSSAWTGRAGPRRGARGSPSTATGRTPSPAPRGRPRPARPGRTRSAARRFSWSAPSAAIHADPPGPERLLPRGQRRVPGPKCRSRSLRSLPRPRSLVSPNSRDGVQQPVPGRAVPLPEQDRLGHQRVDQVGDLPGGDPAHRADRLRGVQVERPGEHRHPPPHGLLRLGQQLVAPLQRRLQRPVMRLAGRAAAGQQLEPRAPAGTGSARATATAAAPRPVRPPAGSRPAPGTPRPPPRRCAASTREPRQHRRGRVPRTTAPPRTAAVPPGPLGAPSAGTVMGGTAIVTSPATPSTCRWSR